MGNIIGYTKAKIDSLLSGFVPTTRTVNAKVLSSDIALSQDDVADGTTAKQYTATEKTKLAGLAAGAEVNVNADWNSVSGDSQILNKPTLGTAAAQASTAFATAAQGTKADSAVQPARTVAGHALSADVTIVKGDVGLGNVDNTADTAKPVSTLQQTALDLKAPLASPVFTGNPTAPTPTAGDNDTSIANTAFVGTAVAAKYTKPGTGIPSSDMATAVQTSLGKADAALPGTFALNGVTGIWIGTQAQYTALGTYVSTVVYVITA